jgi:lipopolysaccharide biosynthesis regulator YciM
MLDLGSEYEQLDIDVSGFTAHDWKLIKYALNKSIEQQLNLSEEDIEDMQTLVNIIENAGTIEAEHQELSWKDAIKATEEQFKVMSKDDSDLDVIKQFCEEADEYEDEEELNEHWKKDDVDAALTNFRIEMNDGDPDCYSAIEEAVIHFEDLLDS